MKITYSVGYKHLGVSGEDVLSFLNSPQVKPLLGAVQSLQAKTDANDNLVELSISQEIEAD
jgi:hypothetical protein